MFDIGFWEILIIVVVALLVVGPERLPGLAREIGRFVGKTRRFVQSVRSDVEREFQTEELREMVKSQDREIRELKHMVEDTESELREDLEETEREIKQDVRGEKKTRTQKSRRRADSEGLEDTGKDDADNGTAKSDRGARPAVRERRTPPEPAGRETAGSRERGDDDPDTAEDGEAPAEEAWDAAGDGIERVPLNQPMGPDMTTDDPALEAERERRGPRKGSRRYAGGRRPRSRSDGSDEHDDPADTDADHSSRTPDERS